MKSFFKGVLFTIIPVVATAFLTVNANIFDFASKAPTAKLSTGEMITVSAGEPIQFNAELSTDPDTGKEQLKYHWKVGGLSIGQSPIASCNLKSPAFLECIFLLSGTHSITVEVSDGENKSIASTTVQVEKSNGYNLFYITGDRSAKEIAALREASLFAIDWAAVQLILGETPIILWQPSTQKLIYASNLTRDIERAKMILGEGNLRSPAEISLLVSGKLTQIITKLEEQFAEANISIRVLPLTARDIFPASERDLGRSALRSVSSFEEAKQIIDKGYVE